jgi:hypothetical protein
MANKKEVVIESGVPVSPYGDKGGHARWEKSSEYELQQRLEPKYKAWSKENRSLKKAKRIMKAQL